MNELLQALKDKNFDGLNFYRNENGQLTIDGFGYKKFGEKLPGSEMGDLYDIIIFQEDPLKPPERFRAILSSPLHYVDRMLDDGFFGVVGKSTTTSENLMDEIFQELTQKVMERIKESGDFLNDAKV